MRQKAVAALLAALSMACGSPAAETPGFRAFGNEPFWNVTLSAADGREAFAVLQREKPDLVILDLQMPNQTGTDFFRRLTKDKELSQTPVIVVSGLAGRHLAFKQPVAVFDKPIDPDEFGEMVDKTLGIDEG